MKAKSFEASFKELEAIIEKMEQGEHTLEESLKYYEKGIALFQACSKELQNAKLKLSELQKEDDSDEPHG